MTYILLGLMMAWMLTLNDIHRGKELPKWGEKWWLYIAAILLWPVCLCIMSWKIIICKQRDL